jgi:hypothetical protein
MASIKDEFHQLIDSIEDEAYLKDLFDSVVSLAQRKGDVLDDLSATDLARLDSALAKAQAGKGLPDSVVRERYAQWIAK